MAQVYRSKDGDSVDWIVWTYYGTTDNRLVEIVLEANNSLAEYGGTLPEGVSITLPDYTAPSTTTGVSLWD